MAEAIDASAVADAIANVVGPSAAFLGDPPPPLPQGWVLKESRSNPGCCYYYNILMGISSWQPPVLDEAKEEQVDSGAMQKQLTTQPQDVPKSYSSITESKALPPGDLPKDPEVSEDRSSKRHKPQTSSSSGPKEVRVLHILKKHKGSRRPSSWRQPKITSTKEEATEELLGLLEIITEEESNPEELRATFEEIARTESDCSSAKRGGDLGFFGRRKMQPAFEQASFDLKVGELTKEVVETSSGFHLILRIG
ncbi:unnamed protein product [Cylindrotheca closterium]|uniref:Peptidyl-prolyl cis-trans isomerase n=1 Tax=Cylindrotheca closterium TaxID=2856 RepID=A0AAD2FEB8_9STRA|nr:unnamed protein product [Cylindrotheca closterium]